MDWDAIEQKVATHYPYPLAKCLTSYFLAKPQGIQSTIWTYRLVNDIIQYVTLALVADLYQHKQLVSLMPHYALRDWIELLERQIREEFLRNSQQRTILEIVSGIHRKWQEDEIKSAGRKISWYEQAKNSPYFPPVDWDEEVCGKILTHMCNAIEPLLDFSLLWISPKQNGKAALCLKGIDPSRWTKIALDGCTTSLNDLALYHNGSYTNLFPFFIARQASRTRLEVLLWDGDTREKKVLYHEQNQDWMLPFDEVKGYQEVKLARCLPDSSYAGLIRHSSHQVKRFSARNSQGGRYPRLVFLPPYELIAELNNFLAGRFYRAAAVLTGEQGVGKTNLVCSLAQQWSREGHLPIIVEARDVKEGTLKSLAAKCYGKNHSWNILLKEVPAHRGKRCIIILSGLEKHPNIESLLEQLQQFLQKYENPSYPLCVLLVCDSDFLSEQLSKRQDFFVSDLFYHPQRGTGEYPFIMELPALPDFALEKTYLQYQKISGCQIKTPCSKLSPMLRRRLCKPIWLKLLSSGAMQWEIPTNIKSEEILYNYLEQNLWEHPSFSRKFEQVLPLFARESEILESILKEHSEIVDGEFFDACRRRGILEKRTALNGKEKIAFCLPIVRDFLLARYFFEKRESELLEKIEPVNYKVAAWLLYFHFLREPGKLPWLWENLSQYPKIVADALALFEETWPISGKQSKQILSLCEELLSRGELGVKSVLAFLDKIAKNADKESFHSFCEFLRDKDSLNPEQILQMLQIAAKHFSEVNPDQWSELLDQESTAIQASRLLSEIHYRRGDFHQALDLAKKVVEATDKQEAPQKHYRNWQQVADCYFALENYPQARQYYEKILRLAQDLNDAKTFITTGYHMAQIHERNDDLEAAISCYDEILDLDQQLGNVLDQMKALEAKGTLEEKQGRADEAQKYYQQAYELAGSLSAYPQMAEILAKMAGAYRGHDEDKALQYYEYALKLARLFNHPQFIAEISCYLADCYDERKEKDKAISLLNDTLKIYACLVGQKSPKTLAALEATKKKLQSIEGKK